MSAEAFVCIGIACIASGCALILGIIANIRTSRMQAWVEQDTKILRTILDQLDEIDREVKP